MSLLSLALGGAHPVAVKPSVHKGGFLQRMWKAIQAEQTRRAALYRLDEVSPEEAKDVSWLAARDGAQR